MEWRPETWLIIRDLYNGWQCGRVDAGGIRRLLEDSGIVIDSSFIELLEQHGQARDISFSVFIRTLKRQREVTARNLVTVPNGEASPKMMQIMITKDIPLPSSVKAPFGTDHNVYVRGFRPRDSVDPVSLSVLRDAISESRSSRAAVPGSVNAFKESTAPSDNWDTTSQNRLEIPRHLKPTINPITGEQPESSRESVNSYALPFIRRQMGNESHLQPIDTGIAPVDTADFHESQRRHYSFFNQQSTPADTVSTDSSSPRTFPLDNILSHNNDREPESYRPMSRITVSKLKVSCPFATDRDDLESLRTHLHSTPLGKPYVPSVYATQ